MGKYSEYGLDENKKSQDEGTVGKSFCLWCKGDMKIGFSMCFSHFAICMPCLETAHDKGKRWDKDVACFKCKKKVLSGLCDDQTKDTKAGEGFYICEDCITWGKEILNNKEKYFTQMVQEILKQCTVEGLVIKLPSDKLPGDKLKAITAKMEAMGGKWKAGKTQGFVFPADPSELLAAAIEATAEKESEEPAAGETTEDPIIEQQPEATIEHVDVPVQFFEMIAPLIDGIDVNILLQHSDGKLTVSVLPQTTASIKPVRLKGQPAELDEGFMSAITGPLTDAKKMKIDLDEYMKTLQPAAEAEPSTEHRSSTPAAAAEGTAPKKKTPIKNAVAKTSKPAAPDMFAEIE